MTTTPAPLTPSERSALDAALRTRQRELRADVAAKLRTQDDPRLVGLRNQMEDTDDWAAADAAAAQDIALVSRDLAELANVRGLIAAPIVGEAGPLGAIEVMSHVPSAFDDIDIAVLGGLAEQAAIAITNARLIDELERSKRALARRADTERSLRDITARIAALTDPDELLERVVEEARRLLDTDGAHLTRMAPEGDSLIPVVVAGGADVVIEVTSYATEPVSASLDYVRLGGTVVLAGVKGFKPVPGFVSDKIVVKEIVVRGAIGVTSSGYRSAIRAIESGRWALERMHTHDFPLEEAERAIRVLSRQVPGEESIHSCLLPSL